MQVVILAAGRGTRMGALTETLPKPLLEVSGKTLLEHKFDVLPDSVGEIILVVGYLQEKIRARFGDSYGDKKVSYVEQENIVGGTADALWQAKEIIRDRFLVMMGDDLYARADVEHLAQMSDWALAVSEIPSLREGGKIVEEDGRITDIVEGKHDGGPGFVNTNLLALDSRVFDYPPLPKAPGSSELGLPQTILAASRQSGIPFEAVPATSWIQITAPEDLQKAEQLLANTGA